jgi:hypothetical protein
MKYKVTGTLHRNKVVEYVDSDSKATLYELYAPAFGYNNISIVEANEAEIEGEAQAIQESQNNSGVVIPSEAELEAMAREQMHDPRYNGSGMTPPGQVARQPNQAHVALPQARPQFNPQPVKDSYKHYKLGDKELRVNLATGVLEERIWAKSDTTEFPNIGFKYHGTDDIDDTCSGFDLYVRQWEVVVDDDTVEENDGDLD